MLDGTDAVINLREDMMQNAEGSDRLMDLVAAVCNRNIPIVLDMTEKLVFCVAAMKLQAMVNEADHVGDSKFENLEQLVVPVDKQTLAAMMTEGDAGEQSSCVAATPALTGDSYPTVAFDPKDPRVSTLRLCLNDRFIVCTRLINERIVIKLAKGGLQTQSMFGRLLLRLEAICEDLQENMEDVPDTLRALLKAIRTGLGAVLDVPTSTHLTVLKWALEQYYSRAQKCPACDVILGLMQEKVYRERLTYLGNSSADVEAAIGSMDAARSTIARSLRKYSTPNQAHIGWI